MRPTLLLLLTFTTAMADTSCPQVIVDKCVCHVATFNNDSKESMLSMECFNLTTNSTPTSLFAYLLQSETSALNKFTSLSIAKSFLGPTLNVSSLSKFKELKSLSIIESDIRSLVGLEKLKHLENLNVSLNSLTDLNSSSGLQHLRNLRNLDLSHNKLHQLDKTTLSGLKNLNYLDISHNLLDETIDPDAFQLLPETLSTLNIVGNPWQCSPLLAWLYPWLSRRTNLSKSSLQSVRCKYDSLFSGQLMLVMRYYSDHVLPTCPRNCSCQLSSVQERLVVAKERVYSVHVDCSNANLDFFPKLPQHTRKIDLRHNKIDDEAFEQLKVIDHHYNEVDELVLDDNLFRGLHEKLLDMRLAVMFSARNNQLATISYDFSQHLVKMTAVIRLANNPWRCTCRSQITDLNLVAKVTDSQELSCGPDSDLTLVGRKIDELTPTDLCPPESTDELRELVLQLLCVLLALLILIVLSRLAFDCYNYKHNNRLPWIALKMP